MCEPYTSPAYIPLRLPGSTDDPGQLEGHKLPYPSAQQADSGVKDFLENHFKKLLKPTCQECGNTHDCSRCSGSGKIESSFLLFFQTLENCNKCEGTGTCQSCKTWAL